MLHMIHALFALGLASTALAAPLPPPPRSSPRSPNRKACSLHFTGDLSDRRAYLEHLIQPGPRVGRDRSASAPDALRALLNTDEYPVRPFASATGGEPLAVDRVSFRIRARVSHASPPVLEMIWRNGPKIIKRIRLRSVDDALGPLRLTVRKTRAGFDALLGPDPAAMMSVVIAPGVRPGGDVRHAIGFGFGARGDLVTIDLHATVPRAGASPVSTITKLLVWVSGADAP